MKKLLIQPCALMIIALSTFAYGCETSKPDPTPETDLSVKIEKVGDSQTSSVTVKFTPEEGTSKFTYAIGQPADLESFLDGKIPGYTTVPNGNPLEYTFEDLEESSYTIFARAYNAEGEGGAPVEYIVKTAKADFAVTKYYVTDISAGFQVITTADYNRYVYYLGTPDDLEAFKNDETSSTSATDTYLRTYNYWKLTPDTEYTFYVKGWNRNNEETNVFAINFRTEPLGSDAIPNVEFTPGRADFYQQTYTVTGNDKCGMIVLRQSTKDYNSQTIEGYHGDIMKMLDIWKDTTSEWMTCFKTTEDVLVANCTTPELALGAELDVYVVIYDNNYNPVGIKKFTPTTPVENPNASKENMGVTITPTQTAQNGIKYTVNTEENVRLYLMDIYNNDEYNKVVAKEGADINAKFQQDLLSRPSSTVIDYDSRESEWTNQEITFLLNKKYYIVVAPTNENGPYGNGFGPVQIKEVTINE